MKTIFVVDDNTVNLITADDTLSDWYNVFTFVSASAMFDFLNNTMPDLILLDIMMPDIDGFEALRRLRADRRYAEIPVIFLTSKNDAATEALGFEMGVIDFISKPFSGPVLLNRIKTHLHIEEFEIIKTHAAEGEKIIDDIISESGDKAFFKTLCLKR